MKLLKNEIIYKEIWIQQVEDTLTWHEKRDCSNLQVIQCSVENHISLLQK